MLFNRLEKEGEKAVLVKEPMFFRDLLLSHKKLSPKALELLFQADRAELQDHLKEAVKMNYWIISDRSFLSGLAYGLANDHLRSSLEGLISFSNDIYQGASFFLDMDYGVRAKKETREEVKGKEFFEKVRGNFYALETKPFETKHGDYIFLTHVDAEQDQNKIHAQVYGIIKNREKYYGQD